MSAYATFTDEETGTEFQWHGGEYIEIGHTAEQDTGPFNDQGDPSYRAGDFVALDVINVWDHAAGVARIEFSEFEQTCRDWLEDE
jgi:hypothetical protein